MSAVNKAKQSSVQDKLTALNDLVAWFHGADFKLEDAVDKFKTAQTLADEIEADLTGLKNEISVVKRTFDSEA